MKRLRLMLLMLLAVGLLVAGCADPVANTLLQDQDPPSRPLRVRVFPAYDPVRHGDVPGTNLVYREWANDPYGYGDGRRPRALEYPYITMLQGGGDKVFSGFNIYRAPRAEGGVYTLLAAEQYPETMRIRPEWNTGDPVPEDPPTASGDELDFPAYHPSLDAFQDYQDPLDPNWNPTSSSGYFPFRYYGRDYRSYGYVDTAFDVATMDYRDYKWAVVFLDVTGNMSEPVIVTVD